MATVHMALKLSLATQIYLPSASAAVCSLARLGPLFTRTCLGIVIQAMNLWAGGRQKSRTVAVGR